MPESAPVARPTARGGSGGRSRRSSEDESEDQTALEELQALFRRCHNSLPFVALFLIYFAYQHATGILVFVVGTVAVMGLDQRVRAQVALKDKASNWHLLGIVAMCAIDMVAICSVDGQPNPLRHFSQMLQSRSTHGSGSDSGLLSTGGVFWQVLWTVLVNVTVNAGEDDDDSTTITPLTQQAVSTVAFYRRKGLILATQGRRIFVLTRSLVTLGLEFGVYVTHDELVEAGSPDCSICYETMRQPVKLACSHMFCEECVTEWFDHERSCPLCRASVGSGPSEDENVKPQFLDGRTSLVPQLL
ncbi:hypothetical protein ON010_g6649 [Phytophthora cinnamomi]|nr:hypothetical protein ON010_g6649 [Phytophthora cinnamomi]